MYGRMGVCIRRMSVCIDTMRVCRGRMRVCLRRMIVCIEQGRVSKKEARAGTVVLAANPRRVGTDRRSHQRREAQRRGGGQAPVLPNVHHVRSCTPKLRVTKGIFGPCLTFEFSSGLINRHVITMHEGSKI